MSYQSLIEDLKDIAIAAGQVILDVYNNVEDVEITKKDDDSPLTIADRKANTLICDGLKQLEIIYPIISEENKAIPYEERKNYDYYWLVDPLDGTKEFIKRNGEFTVNIALIHNNAPVMGVVYAPVLGELYWGIKGEGAFQLKAGNVKQLKANAFSMGDTGLRVVASRSHLNAETQTYVNKLNTPELVSKGSSLKFLLMATADADLYPRLAPTMEWDTAAAQIVLEEAGGKVLQYGTDEPLKYNKENLLNPYFVASGRVR
jgi:3'(2'), 5'-bisphosphate nucleotidase